jgi:hypothetical protein
MTLANQHRVNCCLNKAKWLMISIISPTVELELDLLIQVIIAECSCSNSELVPRGVQRILFDTLWMSFWWENFQILMPCTFSHPMDEKEGVILPKAKALFGRCERLTLHVKLNFIF